MVRKTNCKKKKIHLSEYETFPLKASWGILTSHFKGGFGSISAMWRLIWGQCKKQEQTASHQMTSVEKMAAQVQRLRAENAESAGWVSSSFVNKVT